MVTRFTKTNRTSISQSLPLRRLLALMPFESLESRIFLSNTWYVSTTGSNSNPGTAAQPFKTIQYAANMAGPGDVVDVYGGVYHETVTVHNSGTAAAPIIFQPYDNQTVTIDGADPITGWTKSSGSIWTASMPENLGTGNNQIFVDGQMVNEARWPASPLNVTEETLAATTVGASKAVDSPDSATIYSPLMTQPAGFWVGGSINVGPGQDWVRQTGTITASGVGWVTFSYDERNPTYEQPTVGTHFYLFGLPGALDSAGQWFRSSNGQLSLWTPTGDSPANHDVEAKARLYGFDVSQASYIQINGFNFFACSINTSSASTDVVINHITDQYVSQFSLAADGWVPPNHGGIVLAGADDVLENSTIAHSAGDGVYVLGTGDSVNNNVIHDIDYSGFDLAPVQLAGWNDVINGNTLYDAGRDGIFFSGGGRDTITHNLVYDFGLLDTDLGGFYCFGTNGWGTVIAYNDFYNGVTGGYGGAGIMFDNNSSNFVAYRNITTNVNIGLRINENAIDILVYNNTFDATQWGMTIHGIDDWTGTQLINNIFTKPGQGLGLHATYLDNITNNGQFVDAAAGNFNLLPGAPAINSGMLLPPYTNGFTGKAPDIGALEYGVPDFAIGANLSQVPTPPSPVVTPPVVTPPATTPTPPLSATTAINAMNFNAKQGSEAESLGGLGYNNAGSWVEYSDINFGTGVSKVTFQLAVADPWAGQQVILRLDSPTGPIIGTLTAVGTGSWATYTAQTAAIKGATGVHNLYLCMGGKGPVGNIQSFVFS